MNEQTQDIVIRTGGDPRHLEEFQAIREEINKINHPAQQEVNWKLIESLALSVFRRNGVDLQTSVYYALARFRVAGLAGFTEGCELLAGVIGADWQRCWPENEMVRIELLDWFNAKASNILRTLSFEKKDLEALTQTENALKILSDKLQQLPLRRVPRVENLQFFIHNTCQRLEQDPVRENIPPSPVPEKLIWVPGIEESDDLCPRPEPEPTKLVTCALPPGDEPAPTSPETASPPVKKTRWIITGFFGGLCCCLLVALTAYYLYVVPMKKQLEEIASLPSGSAILWLSQPDLRTYARQMESLATNSPLQPYTLGERFVKIARQTWPTDPLQQSVTRQWEAQMQAGNNNDLTGQSYFVVQQQLQKLNDELISQERSRGGLTISYLKTAVYQMQTALNADVPLEELLRRLENASQTGHPSAVNLMKQIDDRWDMLSRHYYLLVQKQKEPQP
ncbi:VasL domain-containing protein [Trabulsiella odontotermitis]|uniref:VasL domain-containing protein n=1 Tax=Trabulsiella odontotermitis TaxID=379893 RepID=UPI0006BA6414|nr:VasL domain-containing protein [Trabulsiella odontotermitis]